MCFGTKGDEASPFGGSAERLVAESAWDTDQKCDCPSCQMMGTALDEIPNDALPSSKASEWNERIPARGQGVTCRGC